jgi:monoamine oxidase
MTDDALVTLAMTDLGAMFGGGVPTPVAQRVTRWARDPFALGAYSHLPPGARPADRDALAAPVGERLFFAGEATHRDHSATIRGAFESGARPPLWT